MIARVGAARPGTLPHRGSLGRCPAALALFALALATGCAHRAPAAAVVAQAADTVSARAAAAVSTPRILDAFESAAPWTATPADGVSLTLGTGAGLHGRALRMDFDFHGHGGYAVAHRALPLHLPDNYEFTFWIRGDSAPANNLEFKLIEPGGDNVWWVNQRDFTFPEKWTQVTIRKRQVQFAWGPKGGGTLDSIAALEIAITAGSGGSGTVWLDDLTLTPREPVRPYDLTPSLTATSARDDSPAGRALDGDSTTAWRSTGAGPQSLAIDFGRNREFGGLVIDWDARAHATDYIVRLSADGGEWSAGRTVAGGNGGRDYIFLPETEARYVRLDLERAAADEYAIREITVEPLAWSASRNAFFEAIALDAPAGSYPRYLRNEASFWTVVGVAADTREGLLNSDGMLESGRGQFSVEPFLFLDGRLVTWHDVRSTQSLAGGYLPIPSVTWHTDSLALTITAFANGAPDSSVLFARYRVANRAARPVTARLFLAIRPFQVDPSYQFLNGAGGHAPVESLAFDEGVVRVNDDCFVIPLGPPDGFGAVTFDGGGIVPFLRRGALPPVDRVSDDFAAASGALDYLFALPARATRDIDIAIPLHDAAAVPLIAERTAGTQLLDERLDATSAAWRERLARVRIELPPSGERLTRTLRSTVAYILINGDGPGLQPGSRSYERSWIRDGALTSAALLRVGEAEAVRAFLEWYAPFQYANGKVPCCVDARGADPVPENDSNGELIFAIAEYFRYTGDTAFLRRMWPHVERAVAYIDSLRHERMTAEYSTGDKQAFYGLLPESISHEGYSAKPMHSFWDDLFALRGLKDAAALADSLGHTAEARTYADIRDAFHHDVMQAYRRAMADHHIDYLPGSVELGDFDATSTTIAVAPGGELPNLPEPALRNTFDRYWKEFVERRDGEREWDAYTPYELRVAGTFIRLGEKARAHALLDFFFIDQRPAAWNQWAEVVWHDSTGAKFVGDMPHTWVGSDFIRSATDMFAYEDEAEDALVIGAGITDTWVMQPAGVVVVGLRTWYGPLSYTMRGDGHSVHVHIDGGLTVPAGGIRIRSPLDRPLRSVIVNGRPVPEFTDGEVRIASVPADIELRY